MRQGRYDEANDLLAQVAAEQSGRLRVLAIRLRVWSLAAAGKFEDAMDEAAGLAEQVMPDPAETDRPFWTETAERLGQVTGYAAGPGSDELAENVRRR